MKGSENGLDGGGGGERERRDGQERGREILCGKGREGQVRW